MANNNPFAAFQNAAAPGPQNIAQPGNPFGATQPAAPVQAFGAAPQQQLPQQPPQGGFAGQPQQPTGDFGGGYGLPNLDEIGESSGKNYIPLGDSVLVFAGNSVKKRKGHTAIIHFKIERTTNTQYGSGSPADFVKKLPREQDKVGTAIGFLLVVIRAMAGYNDEASFKQAVPFWSQLLAAALHGDPRFAQWAAGKRVMCRATQGTSPMLDAQGKPTGSFWPNYEWFVAPPAA